MIAGIIHFLVYYNNRKGARTIITVFGKKLQRISHISLCCDVVGAEGASAEIWRSLQAGQRDAEWNTHTFWTGWVFPVHHLYDH